MDLSMFAQKKNKEVLPTNSLACQSSSLISNYSLYKLLIFSLNELTINFHKGGGEAGAVWVVCCLFFSWLFFCWFPGCSSAGSGSCYSVGCSSDSSSSAVFSSVEDLLQWIICIGSSACGSSVCCSCASCSCAGYSCAGFSSASCSSALVFCYFLSPGRSCAVFNLASICFSFLCFWLINPTFWFHNLN